MTRKIGWTIFLDRYCFSISGVCSSHNEHNLWMDDVLDIFVIFLDICQRFWKLQLRYKSYNEWTWIKMDQRITWMENTSVNIISIIYFVIVYLYFVYLFVCIFTFSQIHVFQMIKEVRFFLISKAWYRPDYKVDCNPKCTILATSITISYQFVTSV